MTHRICKWCFTPIKNAFRFTDLGDYLHCDCFEDFEIFEQQVNEKEQIMNQNLICKWCFVPMTGAESRIKTEKGSNYHRRCFVMAKNRIVVKPPGWGKWLAGALLAISFALFFALLILTENSDLAWR